MASHGPTTQTYIQLKKDIQNSFSDASYLECRRSLEKYKKAKKQLVDEHAQEPIEAMDDLMEQVQCYIDTLSVLVEQYSPHDRLEAVKELKRELEKHTKENGYVCDQAFKEYHEESINLLRQIRPTVRSSYDNGLMRLGQLHDPKSHYETTVETTPASSSTPSEAVDGNSTVGDAQAPTRPSLSALFTDFENTTQSSGPVVRYDSLDDVTQQDIVQSGAQTAVSIAAQALPAEIKRQLIKMDKNVLDVTGNVLLNPFAPGYLDLLDYLVNQGDILHRMQQSILMDALQRKQDFNDSSEERKSISTNDALRPIIGAHKEDRIRATHKVMRDLREKLGLVSDSHAYYFEQTIEVEELAKAFISTMYQNPDIANALLVAQQSKTLGQKEWAMDELNAVLGDGGYVPATTELTQADVTSTALGYAKDKMASMLTKKSQIHQMNQVFSESSHDEESLHTKQVLATILRQKEANKADASTLNEKSAQMQERLKELSKKVLTAEVREYASLKGVELTPDIDGIVAIEPLLQLVEIAQHLDNCGTVERNALQEKKVDILNKMLIANESAILDWLSNETSFQAKDIKKLKGEKRKRAEEANAKKELAHCRKAFGKIIEDVDNPLHQDLIARLEENNLTSAKDDFLETCREIAAIDKIIDSENGLNSHVLRLDKSDDKNPLEPVKAITDYVHEFVDPTFTSSLQKHLTSGHNLNSSIKKAESGGSFACLSLVPVHFNLRGQSRKICFVAMSGLGQFDSQAELAAAQTAVRDYCQQMNEGATSEDYQFAYINDASPEVDFLLDQVNKSLMLGPDGPLTKLPQMKHDSVYQQVSNNPYKGCSEKKLISELMKLAAVHGENMKIMGCANMALPRSVDADEHHQQCIQKSLLNKVIDLKARDGISKKKAKADHENKSAIELFEILQQEHNALEEKLIIDHKIQSGADYRDATNELKNMNAEQRAQYLNDHDFDHQDLMRQRDIQAYESSMYSLARLPDGREVILESEFIKCCDACKDNKCSALSVLSGAQQRAMKDEVQHEHHAGDMHHAHQQAGAPIVHACGHEVKKSLLSPTKTAVSFPCVPVARA